MFYFFITCFWHTFDSWISEGEQETCPYLKGKNFPPTCSVLFWCFNNFAFNLEYTEGLPFFNFSIPNPGSLAGFFPFAS